MIKELKSSEVIYKFDLNDIGEMSRGDYKPEYQSVYEDIKMALEIEKDGYNVYLIDDFSMDKLDNIISFVENSFKSKGKPRDICYVIENNIKSPRPIFLINGNGNVLKKYVEEIQNTYSNITYEFYNSAVNKKKEAVINDMHKKRNDIITRLMDISHDNGFDIKSTDTGFSFIPLVNGEIMTEKEYDRLTEEEKSAILDKINNLKETAQDVLEELQKIEVEGISVIKDFLKEYFQIEIEALKAKFNNELSKDEEALTYLNFICMEIQNNIISNYTLNYDNDEEKINEVIYKYEVNVIVDNSSNQKPVVIFEEDPSITNLIGCIDYENHNGVYVTDTSLIKAGSIIRSNEGCLIIRANSLLSNPSSYYYLKKYLMSGKLDFDYNRAYLEILSLGGLKPNPLMLDVKIILIGDYETYDLLYTYDEDFKKVFKIRTEARSYIDICKENIKYFMESIGNICKKNSLKSLTTEAICEVAKLLSRKAENRNRLFLDDNELNRILMLSNNKVTNEGRDSIEATDIIQIIDKEQIIEEEILRNYKNKKILMDVREDKVGVVNGLSVVDIGYLSFGKPIRITCTCYKGEGNIIDVEKESDMSGNIHNKAVNILKGYLNNFIGGYEKLPVDFHMCFEQVYGKIDGDSASVAEIVSIISALSKLPVRQNIAVTGSINQFGEVQPIGGVNEKIEGFFKTCKLIDDVEGKGVIIPELNKEDLVLKKEIESEILKGRFHIYTMRTVEDALEILIDYDDSKNIRSIIEKEIKKYIEKRK